MVAFNHGILQLSRIGNTGGIYRKDPSIDPLGPLIRDIRPLVRDISDSDRNNDDFSVINRL